MSVMQDILNFLSTLRLTYMTEIDVTGFENFNKKPGGFKPSWIILHHSYSSDGFTRNWDSIKRYHMSYRFNGDIISEEQYTKLLNQKIDGLLEKPWHDVGYHFGIENDHGKLTVFPGRLIGEIGSHAKGFNDKSIGICLVGNYDICKPDADRLHILSHLCRQLQLEFKIPRDQVIGHRETYQLLKGPVQKSCPGAEFDLVGFRTLLRD